jgi:hypothetical protein
MQVSHASEFAVSNLEVLEKQLQSCMEYVPFVEDNQKVISPKFIHIVLDACSLIDSIFHQLSDGARKRSNLKKYSEMHEPQLELEAAISLFLSMPIRALTPFAGWTKCQPEWWTAYNMLKHDRLKNYTAATFQNAVLAFVGLHQVVSRLKQFMGPLLRASWIDTTEIETIEDLGSVAHLGALHPAPPSLVVESRLVASPTRENFVRSFDGLYFDIDFKIRGTSPRIRNLLFAHEEW